MRVSNIFKHRYEAIAFMTGAAVMVLEIVGGRLIAPYFGTSTYVWTAMIGVILGALAAGYAIGGKLADRDNAERSLSGLILLAAILVMALGLLQTGVLEWLAGLQLDLRLSTLLAATLLFAAPSLLIGMVSPHLAKIRITSLQTSGKSVGRLEAAGALGSIAGTFLCGYVLLGLFGSRAIITGVVIALIGTSLLALPRGLFKVRLGMLVTALLIGVIVSGQRASGIVADVDSSYARYRVIDTAYGDDRITALTTDNRGIQSGVSQTDPNKLVFNYIQQFDNALNSRPESKSILVVGGGTFTFPAAAARQYPELKVDVVEIDPRLTTLAERYFSFKKPSNLTIINEDGRTYLNRSSQRYDMIFMDAYNAFSPPFQVTTRQALAAARDRLKDDGVLVSNVIGRSDGYFDPYLQAMLATTANVFGDSSLHPADDQLRAPGELRNYIIVAGRSSANVSVVATALGTPAGSRNPNAQVLTDDFAPVEQLINRSGH